MRTNLKRMNDLENVYLKLEDLSQDFEIEMLVNPTPKNKKKMKQIDAKRMRAFERFADLVEKTVCLGWKVF